MLMSNPMHSLVFEVQSVKTWMWSTFAQDIHLLGKCIGSGIRTLENSIFFFFFGRGAHGERGNIFNCTFRASSLVLLMGMLRIFRNKVGSAHRIASEAAKHSVQRHIKHFYKM